MFLYYRFIFEHAVLFASPKVFAVESEGKTIGRGTGERCIYTDERPHHLAKNRWSMPYEIPLKWEAFAAAYATATKAKK